MTDERVLGPIGTEVVFENDRVRIWEMRLEPGESSAVHRHDLDYMLVLLDGDKIAAEPEPDTQGAFDEYLEADVVPGSVVYIERGGVETAKNVGQLPYREIIIELKD
ncbi:MAG TPA: cupin [Acidimicrobiia bacterium]|nr:cupin [Acidimicrobiia bacterium]